MRRFFDKELEQFRSDIILMSEKTIQMVEMALRALFEEDVEALQRVRGIDDEVDELQMRIDEEGMRFLSLRAPVTGDLRLMTMGMKVGHELERIADEACSIAKRSRKILERGNAKPAPEFNEMGKIVLAMLRDVTQAAIHLETNRVKDIPLRDGKVDAFNLELQQMCTEAIQAHEGTVTDNLDFIFIAKALERIGDHSENIAEDIIYLVEAQDVRHVKEIRDAKKQSKRETREGLH